MVDVAAGCPDLAVCTLLAGFGRARAPMHMLLELHAWCQDVLNVKPTENTFSTLLSTCLGSGWRAGLPVGSHASMIIEPLRAGTRIAPLHSDVRHEADRVRQRCAHAVERSQ